jgi:hypothetical protein
MIFTPTTREQTKTAAKLLLNAKGTNRDIKTKIFVPDNNYTIAILCQNDQPPEFPLPGKALDSKNLGSINVLTSKTETSIKDIYDGKKKCNPQPSSLVNIFYHINNAAVNQKQYGKLIIFLQVPWNINELNKSEQKKHLEQLKISIDNLSKTQQVEQIVLFGVDSNTPALLSSSIFKSVTGKITISTSELLDSASLQQINKKLN